MSDTNETAAQDPQGGEPNGAPEVAEGKTYTQADLDRILQGRLAKFSDYDQMKQQLEDLQAANQSDSEKAIADAKKAGEAEAAGKYLSLLMRSEVKAAAAALGFHDPADAHQYIDQESVLVNGEVDDAALAEAIKQVAGAKPYLVKTPEGPPSAGEAGIGVRGGQSVEAGPGVARLEAAYARK